MDALKLIYISIAVVIIGLSSAIGLAYKNGYVNFIKRTHIWGLAAFLIAGLFTWLGIVRVVNHETFHVTTKQWVALIMSLLIAVMVWLRFVYGLQKDDDGEIVVDK